MCHQWHQKDPKSVFSYIEKDQNYHFVDVLLSA